MRVPFAWAGETELLVDDEGAAVVQLHRELN
jgi:hypothetical protein